MTLSDLSIRRPVLTWVMMLGCVVFGVLGLISLGIDLFPAMEFPRVTVSATLPGATPEGIEADVTEILEEPLGSIPGVREIRSRSAPGTAEIILEFGLATDLDVATQDVRDKVGLTRFQLPPHVEPPYVARAHLGSDAMVLMGPVQTRRSTVEGTEIVKRAVQPVLATIPGVSGVRIFGGRERSIRIWLDGEKLRARGLGTNDVLAAIRREHVEVGAGDLESESLLYGVTTAAEFESLEKLSDLVLREVDGASVRLGDVARIEDGMTDEETIVSFLGESTIGFGVSKQSGANAVAIADEVYRRVDEINKILPPDMELLGKGQIMDISIPIREALAETNFALIVGGLLAVLTVFVFLRRWRPTLIVATAIPLSLITTFGITWMLGFTLNTMTLLAMALAVGVVVDDAIVVLENIERHRESGEGSFEAAHTGTREVAFAATAATVSIAVVFIPAIFVGGIVGNFLGEFGVTVAGSVMVSLFVALTLTPMLAARIPPDRKRTHGRLYRWLGVGFENLERNYRGLLSVALAHRGLTLAIAMLSLIATVGLASRIGGELFPPADTGVLLMDIETRPGTTLRSTRRQIEPLERWLQDQPEVAGVFLVIGMQRINVAFAPPNMGTLVVILEPSEKRERPLEDFVAALRAKSSNFPGLDVRLKTMTTVGAPMFSVDLTGNVPLKDLDEISRHFLSALEENGGFVDLSRGLEIGPPEVRIKLDRDKAAALGIDAETVSTVVRAMIGGLEVASFKEAGNRHSIIVRLEEEDRRTPEAVGRLAVRTRRGDVVELRNFADVTLAASPSSISRIDRQRSVRIEANLAPGKRVSEAIRDAEGIAAEILPEGMRLRLSGQAAQYEESIANLGFALALAIIIIYLVLAAQFESFLHPLTVMLALPLAMVGALGALAAAGMTFNLFSLIGIIMLLGLVTKNSILLVDYANQLRATGLDNVEAMRSAAPVRLRPVLMTAVSMIFGVLPAAVGVGPGSATRQPMALAVAAGMFSSTLLTLVVVPVFYVTLDDVNEGIKRRLRKILGRPAEADLAAH